jgi:hypothetical protein
MSGVSSPGRDPGPAGTHADFRSAGHASERGRQPTRAGPAAGKLTPASLLMHPPVDPQRVGRAAHSLGGGDEARVAPAIPCNRAAWYHSANHFLPVASAQNMHAAAGSRLKWLRSARPRWVRLQRPVGLAPFRAAGRLDFVPRARSARSAWLRSARLQHPVGSVSFRAAGRLGFVPRARSGRSAWLCSARSQRPVSSFVSSRSSPSARSGAPRRVQQARPRTRARC